MAGRSRQWDGLETPKRRPRERPRSSSTCWDPWPRWTGQLSFNPPAPKVLRRCGGSRKPQEICWIKLKPQLYLGGGASHAWEILCAGFLKIDPNGHVFGDCIIDTADACATRGTLRYWMTSWVCSSVCPARPRHRLTDQDRQTARRDWQTETRRQTGRNRQTETDRPRPRQTETETETETDTPRQTDQDRQTETDNWHRACVRPCVLLDRDTQTDRPRQTHRDRTLCEKAGD